MKSNPLWALRYSAASSGYRSRLSRLWMLSSVMTERLTALWWGATINWFTVHPRCFLFAVAALPAGKKKINWTHLLHINQSWYKAEIFYYYYSGTDLRECDNGNVWNFFFQPRKATRNVFSIDRWWGMLLLQNYVFKLLAVIFLPFAAPFKTNLITIKLEHWWTFVYQV